MTAARHGISNIQKDVNLYLHTGTKHWHKFKYDTDSGTQHDRTASAALAGSGTVECNVAEATSAAKTNIALFRCIFVFADVKTAWPVPGH